MEIKKRGYYFSVDALIATAFIIIAILILPKLYTNEPDTSHLSYYTQDLSDILTELKITDVKNNPIIVPLMVNITNENNTVLQQIGEFWAVKDIEAASKLSEAVVDGVVPENYNVGIWARTAAGNERLIYTSNANNIPIDDSKYIIVSRHLVSGFQEGNATYGLSTRLLLTGVNQLRTTAYVFFGGYIGDGNITSILNLPSNTTVQEAYLELDTGNDFNLYVNGLYSGTYLKGSSGGGYMLADKWNISSAYLSNFHDGNNTIQINFTTGITNYIGGGFIRVRFNTTDISNLVGTENGKLKKIYYFPGIRGIINIFDSFYVPGTLTGMNISLKFMSNYSTFLNIAGTDVFEDNSSGSNLESFYIRDDELKTKLNYNFLSKKTIPIRLGTRNISLSSGNGRADTVLITDKSGSMTNCDVESECINFCDNSTSDGDPCQNKRGLVAEQADSLFISTMLEVPGNQVGLVGYGDHGQVSCAISDLDSNEGSSKEKIYEYFHPDYKDCSYTCISCGIMQAGHLLLNNQALYELNKISSSNSTKISLGTSIGVYQSNRSVFLDINKEKFVKAKLNIQVEHVDIQDEFYQNNQPQLHRKYQDCIFLNSHYLGRACRITGGTTLVYLHDCEYAINKEWLNDGENIITLTAGDKNNGCLIFGSGSEPLWSFKNVTLSVWEVNTNNNINVVSAMDTSYTHYGDDLTPRLYTKNTTLNLNIDPKKVRSAYITLDAKEINVQNNIDYFQCLYVNNYFIADLSDPNLFNPLNVWQNITLTLPVEFLRTGNNIVSIYSGDTYHCERHNNDVDDFDITNINITVIQSDFDNNYSRLKSMLVMSDGQANTALGGKYNYDSFVDPSDEAVEVACDMHNNYNVSLYAVAFGNAGSEAIQTLQRIACCDDCSHFFTSNNADELLDIYKNISQSIVEISYVAQLINATGEVGETILDPNSYIELEYEPIQQQDIYGSIPINIESERFNNLITEFNVSIPNVPLLDAKITSYSADKWTSLVQVNNFTPNYFYNVYNLTIYGESYPDLGDPFIVQIPIDLLEKDVNNTIRINTGLAPKNQSGGSLDDRFIYTVLVDVNISSSVVAPSAEGCTWSVSFEDGTSSTIPIPASYTGSNVCAFTSLTNCINYQDDAINYAVCNLFKKLDFDNDGLVFVNFDQADIDIENLQLYGIPYLWGPSIIEVRAWL